MPSQKQTAQHAKMLMLEIPSERTNKISTRKARKRENTPRRVTVGSHANESTVVHSKESENPMMKHKEHWKRRNNKVKKQTSKRHQETQQNKQAAKELRSEEILHEDSRRSKERNRKQKMTSQEQ